MKLKFTKLETESKELIVNFGSSIKKFNNEQFEDIKQNGIPFTTEDLINGDLSKIQIKTKINNVVHVKSFKDGIETAIDFEEADIESVLKIGDSNFVQLDENGKLPIDRLPTEALVYKGQYDASTNVYPANGKEIGDFYIISVEGDIDSIHFYVGDWIIWDGSKWTRSANTNAVASVNGKTGNVVLSASDVGAPTINELQSVVKNIESSLPTFTLDGDTLIITL